MAAGGSETCSQGGDNPSVAERIHRRLDQLTRAERKPARVLLANYPLAGLDPLAEFAGRAGVSHPTILRFVAKLGFSGYPPFQATLRDELKARLKSPLAKRGPPEALPAGAGQQDFLSRFADAVCDNIRQSIAALPRAEFDAVLTLLADTGNTVYVLGGRFTDAIATYFYRHLRVLRARVQHVTGPPVSWSEYLLDMDRDAVLVVFDVRRYQDEVVQFAAEAAGRGACVLLVTDQWLSPIASAARHVLAMRIEVPSNWDSAGALTALAEALIAALSNRHWGRFETRIRELEGLRARVGGQGAVD